ncbi:MAG: hypothetical protein JO058_20860 [Alphaproteobacteria bacterium]|nr:hypothetical protein [Alphaproteobacteria bacterium]
MALAVMPGGDLHPFLPKQPRWYSRIGGKVLQHVAEQRLNAELYGRQFLPLHSLDRQRLEFMHQLALGRRRGAETGPVYAEPAYASLEQARCALGALFDNIAAETLAYHAGSRRMAA